MCSNYVTFSGEKKNMISLLLVIENMVSRSEKQAIGVIPLFQEKVWESYYFSLVLQSDAQIEDSFITISYESKWCPNIKDLSWLAQKFDVSFLSDYDECGNNIKGAYKYDHKTKEAFVKSLTDEEIDQCNFWFTEEGQRVKSSHDTTDEEEEKFNELNYYLEENFEMMDDLLSEKSYNPEKAMIFFTDKIILTL